jgi:hypothetical protein
MTEEQRLEQVRAQKREYRAKLKAEFDEYADWLLRHETSKPKPPFPPPSTTSKASCPRSGLDNGA